MQEKDESQAKQRSTKAKSSKAKPETREAELTELRDKLESVRAESNAAADEAAAGELTASEGRPHPGSKQEAAASGTRSEDEGAEAEAWRTAAEVLAKDFKDLIDGFDEELREPKPTTLLTVFAVGILTGWLLSR